MAEQLISFKNLSRLHSSFCSLIKVVTKFSKPFHNSDQSNYPK